MVRFSRKPPFRGFYRMDLEHKVSGLWCHQMKWSWSSDQSRTHIFLILCPRYLTQEAILNLVDSKGLHDQDYSWNQRKIKPFSISDGCPLPICKSSVSLHSDTWIFDISLFNIRRFWCLTSLNVYQIRSYLPWFPCC